VLLPAFREWLCHSLATLEKLVRLESFILFSVRPAAALDLPASTENRRLIAYRFSIINPIYWPLNCLFALAFLDFLPQHSLINGEMTDAQ
jgi:hypothetical protein